MTASSARAARRRSSGRLALLAALACAALAACGGERELVAVHFSSFMNGTWAGQEYTLPQGATFWTRPYAVYSDGTTEVVDADWTESVPSIVQVVPTGSGMMIAVTGLAPGVTVVTATYRGVRGDIPLRVY